MPVAVSPEPAYEILNLTTHCRTCNAKRGTNYAEAEEQAVCQPENSRAFMAHSVATRSSVGSNPSRRELVDRPVPLAVACPAVEGKG